MYEIKGEISKYKRIVKHHDRLGEIEIALVTDDIAAEIMVALANKALLSDTSAITEEDLRRELSDMRGSLTVNEFDEATGFELIGRSVIVGGNAVPYISPKLAALLMSRIQSRKDK